jgi:hypothetical protein
MCPLEGCSAKVFASNFSGCIFQIFSTVLKSAKIFINTHVQKNKYNSVGIARNSLTLKNIPINKHFGVLFSIFLLVNPIKLLKSL